MIKKHWPILFTILMVVISIALGIAASHSTDTGYAIAVGVVIFMVLFPLAGAVLGGWYGWRIRSPLKWLLAPAAFLGVCLFLLATDLITGSGSMEIDTYGGVSSPTGAACLAAEAVAAVISWAVRRRNR